jgi:crotonobetainyl-CoA:carnitine CoA-transferase CaiB-like acyl-CoA transferase
MDAGERNGGHVGETVTVSLIQAGVSALANQATGYLRAGAIAQRMGSDHPSVVPYGTVFEAADGKLLTLAVGADRQFRNLCTVLGAAELGVDERFATNPQRVRNRDQLIVRETQKAPLVLPYASSLIHLFASSWLLVAAIIAGADC